MSVSELLRRQHSGYPRYHGSRHNLLLHAVAVSVFIAANIGLLACLLQARFLAATACLAIMLVSVALQGRGHRCETLPAEPFTGPVNAVLRILLEQWINFPRYVLGGGWIRAWRRPEGLR